MGEFRGSHTGLFDHYGNAFLRIQHYEGISFGFICYVLLKCAAKRLKQAHPLIILSSPLFILRYIFIFWE
ncbi:MAG: hypothetical protein DRP85_04265 [Candidatus Makaraimicrobium thalassicum]|nr:MAG: hypothetical protein DRP85_04265 [Candidatus Omnitrophota bacterium]